MIGAFITLTKALIIAQYVLVEEVRLVSLSPRRLEYLFFERSIASILSNLIKG